MTGEEFRRKIAAYILAAGIAATPTITFEDGLHTATVDGIIITANEISDSLGVSWGDGEHFATIKGGG